MLQYSIHIHNSSCSFVAMINGVPVYNNPDGVAFNINFSMNHLVKNGQNTFTIILRPYPDCEILDKFTQCNSKIIVKKQYEPVAAFKEIATISYKEGTATKESKTKLATIAGTFNAEIEFADPFWIKSKKIELNTENLIFLKAKIKTLHSLFKQKKLNEILALAKEREQEISNCFYTSFQEGEDISKLMYEEVFSDENWELQPLDIIEYPPLLFAENKLVSFVNLQFDSIIHYFNDKKSLYREFPFYFCLNNSGEFIVIR